MNLSRRAFAAMALLAGSLAAAPAPASRPPPAATPIDRLNLPWWKARHEAVLRRLHEKPVDLLLIGDSITQNWERHGPPPEMDIEPVWRHFYGDRNSVNLGFKGDATAHLLWRIRNGEVDAIAPKAAVVLIGANNLGRVHWSAADTVTGIEAVIGELRRRLPNTRLLLISVLPSVRSAWVDENTRAINAALARRYGQGGEPAWFDATPLFTRNGKTDASLFYDPRLTPPEPALHPSAQGMEALATAIEPIVARMMGDRPKPPGNPTAPR